MGKTVSSQIYYYLLDDNPHYETQQGFIKRQPQSLYHFDVLSSFTSSGDKDILHITIYLDMTKSLGRTAQNHQNPYFGIICPLLSVFSPYAPLLGDRGRRSPISSNLIISGVTQSSDPGSTLPYESNDSLRSMRYHFC